MGEGVRFAIGPLTLWTAPEELRAWLSSAAPGDRCTYAIGPALADHPTRRLAADAAKRGEVHLFQERDGKGLRYGIEKRPPSAEAGGATVHRLRIDAGFAASPEGRLYRVLTEIARAGLALPNYSELAELADLTDRQAAHYRLCLLQKQGRVLVRGQGETREIEIAGKGWVTRAAGAPANG